MARDMETHYNEAMGGEGETNGDRKAKRVHMNCFQPSQREGWGGYLTMVRWVSRFYLFLISSGFFSGLSQ